MDYLGKRRKLEKKIEACAFCGKLEEKMKRHLDKYCIIKKKFNLPLEEIKKRIDFMGNVHLQKSDEDFEKTRYKYHIAQDLLNEVKNELREYDDHQMKSFFLFF